MTPVFMVFMLASCGFMFGGLVCGGLSNAGLAFASDYTPTLTGLNEADPDKYPQSAYTATKTTSDTGFYTTFTILEADADAENGTSATTYGLLFNTQTGGTTASIAELITSYGDDYTIEQGTSGDNISFSVTIGDTPTSFYVENTNQGAVTPESAYDGDYIGNTSTSSGGAISNKASSGDTAVIDDIKGDFIGNTTTATGSDSSYGGGAISNYANDDNSKATIGDVTGDFIGNYAAKVGGAIHNYVTDAGTASIGDITGNFIGNSSAQYGGAIYSGTNNMGDEEVTLAIGNIKGDFIANYISGSSTARGGAIYNIGGSSGTIASITGDFIGNYVTTSASEASGGAIYNYAIITSLVGDFIGNYVTTTTTGTALGGAIYNGYTIGNMIGDFIGNKATSTSGTAYGGAIYNIGTIGDVDEEGNFTGTAITGSFISNSATATTSTAYGGAIYNAGSSAEIGDIKGDFISNHAESTSSIAYGGAIFNRGTISNITGDFTNNYANGTSAQGGAIYNENYTISDIVGSFIGNYAKSATGTVAGGAIYNFNATINNIEGDFTENYAESTGGTAYGGAIYLSGMSVEIGDITGSFTGNYAKSTTGDAYGGAIYNKYGAIGNIIGDFSENYAESTESTDGEALGGAIYNEGHATQSTYSATIDSITASENGFYKNTAQAGGAIYNANSNSIITSIIADFTENTATEGNGGAIYNAGTIGDISGSFTNNYAESTSGNVYGGAIYTTQALTFVADAVENEFTNNYTSSNGVIDYNAIYVDGSSNRTLTFTMSNGGSFIMNDSILGSVIDYTVAIAGTSAETETFYLNDEIDANGTVTVSNATLELGSYEHSDDDITAKEETTYGSIAGGLSLDQASILNIYGGLVELSKTSSILGAINLISGSFTFNNYYDTISSYFTWSGGDIELAEGTDSLTIASGGTFDVNMDNSETEVEIEKLTVENGASLTVQSGTLYVSDTLTVEANADTFSTTNTGSLKVNLADFGYTLSADGTLTATGFDATILKQLANGYELILTGFGSLTEMTYTAYLDFLDSTTLNNLVANTGVITLLDINILGAPISLDEVAGGVSLSETVLAGDLDLTGETKTTVSAYGIVQNTMGDYSADNPLVDSTIAAGSTLILTGQNDTALLDTGTLKNSGTLYLGSDTVATADFNGYLTTNENATTTVISNVTFSEEVVNDGSMTFQNGTTLQAGLTNGYNNSSAEATFNGTSTIKAINNNGSLIFNGFTTVSNNLVADSGTIDFNDNVTITGNATIGDGSGSSGDSVANFAKDATFTGGLEINSDGKANFTGANSAITGDINTNGELNFKENTTLTGALEVESYGKATFSGETKITGAVESIGTLLFESEATLSDDLTVNGGTTTFKDVTTIADATTVDGGKLIFESTATLSGNLQLDSGSTTFNDTATIESIATISGGSLIFEDVATLKDNLTVSDSAKATFNSTADITGAVESTGTLNFYGNTTINNDLSVKANTTTFTGTTNSVAGNTSLSGGEIIIGNGTTASLLTLTDLDLIAEADGITVNNNATLKVTGEITWNASDDNTLTVNSGGTFITDTSNIYTYNVDTQEFALAENLTNADLTFIGVSTLSFSDVESITKEEYEAVKNVLYNDNNDTGAFGTDLLFNFGDALISNAESGDYVSTGTDTNLNETTINYNSTNSEAIVDGTNLSVENNTITVTATNDGSLGTLNFDVGSNNDVTDLENTTLIYDIGSQSITLAGATDLKDTNTASTSLVGTTANEGTTIAINVVVGDDTGSGTLTLGSVSTSEYKEGVLESVTLNSSSTMNVTGSTQGTDDTPITSAFEVKETTLAENASVKVDNNASLTLSGTTTLGDGASISVVGQSTTIIESIEVAEDTKNTPYIYADPSYVAVKAIENNTLDIGVFVGEGSVIELGESADTEQELEELFEKMDFFTASDLATGGYTPGDTTQTLLYLGLGATLTLGDSGKIIVDDQVADDSSGIINFSDGTKINPTGVYFGADSFFVANVSGLAQVTDDNDGDAVIDGGTQNLYVDSTSTLGIVGASAGTYTILKNFTSTDTYGTSTLWTYDEDDPDSTNVFVGNSLQEITSVDGLGTTESPYQVTIAIKETSSLYEGAVGEIIKNAANYQGAGGYSSTSDNAGVRFIYNVASSVDPSKQEAVIEGAAQLSATSATNANTYQANRASVNIQQGRYHLYDATLLGSQSLGDSGLNVVTRNADGSIKEEFSGVTQVASNGSLDNLYTQDNSVSLWFMPFYNHENVNGMEAGSYTSDYKSDTYGVAIGADKTFMQVGCADAVRIGLSFNVGYGSTRTSGDFNDVYNDFDFYGLSAYGAAQFGKLTLSADVGYTKNESDIDQDLSSYGMESLTSDVDSEMWHFGVRAEYTHTLDNDVKIIPHIGLDLLTMKTGDYNVNANGTQGGTVFTVESERQNVLSVPLGVTVTKNFDLESGWKMTPKAKLGAIFAMGDLKEESIARMPGIEGIANMSTEVVDPATLDLGLGVSASHDNLRLALDYNLQVSKNRTAHGVMAILEYKF